MESLRKQRSISRRFYSLAERDLEDAFEEDSGKDVHAMYKIAKQKAEELFSVDDQIKELWFRDTEANEETIFADLQTAESYNSRWTIVSTKYCRNYAVDTDAIPYDAATVRSQSHMSNAGSVKLSQRRFVLPKIELRKFDGDINNWIAFWGQFSKIHSDPDIDDSDKFQYLVQATEPGSKARELVESFPPYAKNYKKAIEQLKDRFAREGLLIENYIRGLQQLIMNRNENMSLCSLYDKLATHIAALDSLNVTCDKYAFMLLPMVESAIPTETLRLWERTRSRKEDNQLAAFMEFLKREVEGDERVAMSREFAESNSSTSRREPTAACIVASENKKNDKGQKDRNCVWCDKSSHSSIECFRISKLTLDEKKEHLKKNNACTICLRVGHYAKKCRSFPKCLVCSKRHAIPMCPSIHNKSACEREEPSCSSSSSTNAPQITLCQKNSTTLLPTIALYISYNGRKILTRALFDSGAQRSYIKLDLVQSIGMRTTDKEEVSHCLFGGTQIKKGTYCVYNFDICSVVNNFVFPMSALGLKKLTGPLPKLHCPQNINKLRSLNICVSDIGSDLTDVGLLIGADVFGYLLSGQVKQVDSGLFAVETKLGWCVQGPTSSNVSCSISNNISVNFNIADFWELDILGIRAPRDNYAEENITNTLQFFRNSITINNEGRYEITLPWKEGFPEEFGDNNKMLSLKRLWSTAKRLDSLNYLTKYDQVFKDWLSEGIIEETEGNDRGLYLPHHAVIKVSSLTTPVRPVFDASARDRFGNSLNSALQKGANLLEDIQRLLIDFRLQKIGITADIRKAFLQISIQPHDRDYLQFLWWRDVHERKELITYRHRRVVFGVICSPFLLAATINFHLDKVEDYRKPIAQKLKASFYVDNCVTSAGSVDECQEFIDVSKQLMSEGKFDLRGWVTGPSEETQVLSVLGLKWNTKDDTLCSNVTFTNINADNLTKRLLLSCANSIFDPIGFTSPVSLAPKLLLQKCWILRLDWEDKLPKTILQKFQQWLDKIEFLNKLALPRCLTVNNIKYCNNNSLHIFCDASKNAFATCIYLRSELNGDVHVQLVLAKARVAPVKELSLPRLELMATVIGVRLYQQVKAVLEQHKIDVEYHFWTDSSVVLTWIKTEGDWPVFVKNRVKEVRQSSLVEQWHHIPGTMNPADLPSRGCDALQLLNSRWWEGPQWLHKDMASWPIGFEPPNIQPLLSTPSIGIVSIVEEKFSDRFVYFSNYTKIVRSLAWINRFVHNCKYKISDKRIGDISFEEYHSAEQKLFKLLQREYCSDEHIKRKYNLELFIDNKGLIRVQTRLTLHSVESDSFKYPLLLSGEPRIVQRLINHYHCTLQHAGTATVLCNLREQFWILNARKWVKRIVRECPVCRKFLSKAITTPMAPLPEDRIKNAKAFEVTGIDLCGPLILKGGKKTWIVLFTCALYRGVHLELVDSLSTEAFLMALRRFIARRGRISVIYTDNGTNFVGASNLLKDVNWADIEAFSTCKGFQWKFNAPSSPWWGGFWERLMRILKDLLRRMLGKSTLTSVELQTLLCDCEATMNSRPLTYIADDSECLRPLTPACFMLDVSESSVPDLDTLDAASINVRFRYLQKLRDDFRARFRVEYLSYLVQKRQVCTKFTLKPGDVVMLETDSKRHLWPMARILETFVGKDGHVRTAKLQTERGSLLIRPIQKLYPVEVQGPFP